MTSLNPFWVFLKKIITVFDKQKKFHEFQIIITKCGKNLLESVKVLQSVTVITMLDVTPSMISMYCVTLLSSRFRNLMLLLFTGTI